MRRALLSLLVAGPVWAQEPAPEVAAPAPAPLPQALRVKVSGYLQPQAVMKHRPATMPARLPAMPYSQRSRGTAAGRCFITACGCR